MDNSIRLDFILIRNALRRVETKLAEVPGVTPDASFVRMVSRMSAACATVIGEDGTETQKPAAPASLKIVK